MILALKTHINQPDAVNCLMNRVDTATTLAVYKSLVIPAILPDSPHCRSCAYEMYAAL
jgi:hypothetical protein